MAGGTPIILESELGWLQFESEEYVLWGEEDILTYTLFDLSYRVARVLGLVREGVATGGTTTTLIDTNDLIEVDDYWNRGAVWIIRDSAGLGAAPENEYSVITDFTASSDTVTLRSTLTAAVASGDRYAISRKFGDTNILDMIISKINQALSDLGKVPYTDVTSITTANDQTEYTLPLAAKGGLLQVWLQTENADTNDNQWMELRNWEIEHSDRGVADTLILSLQEDSSYALKLVYLANHPQLMISTAKLSEHVPPERVLYPAIRDSFLFMKQRTGWDKWDQDISYWRQRAEDAKTQYPVVIPRKPGKMLVLTNAESYRYYPGDRNPR